MSMGSWMKLPVQSLWKLWAPKKCLGGKRLLYVSWWKVRALRRFRDEMQTNIYGKLGEIILFNLCGNRRVSKMPWRNLILLSLWKVQLSENSFFE